MKISERKKLYIALSPYQQRCYMNNYMRTMSRKVIPPLLAGAFVAMILAIIVFELVVGNSTELHPYVKIFIGSGVISICFIAVLLAVGTRIAEKELLRARALPTDDAITHEQRLGVATPSYATQWHDYRRRRVLFWVSLIVFLPVMLGAQRLHAGFHISICTVACIIFFATSWRRDHWHCPRCAKPFFKTKWFGSRSTKECLHCGLPKWDENNSQQESSNNSMQVTPNGAPDR